MCALASWFLSSPRVVAGVLPICCHCCVGVPWILVACKGFADEMETLGLEASLVEGMSVQGMSSDPPGRQTKGANPGSGILFEFCCSPIQFWVLLERSLASRLSDCIRKALTSLVQKPLVS